MSDLPKIEKADIRQFMLDLTPDADLPVRILEAYRAYCDQRWMVRGLSPEKTAFWDLVHEHQQQRAKILDEAIAVLSRGRKAMSTHHVCQLCERHFETDEDFSNHLEEAHGQVVGRDGETVEDSFLRCAAKGIVQDRARCQCADCRELRGKGNQNART